LNHLVAKDHGAAKNNNISIKLSRECIFAISIFSVAKQLAQYSVARKSKIKPTQ